MYLLTVHCLSVIGLNGLSHSEQVRGCFIFLSKERSWDLRVSHSRDKPPQPPCEKASRSDIQRALGYVPLSEASRCPSAHRTLGIRIRLVAFATLIVPWVRSTI